MLSFMKKLLGGKQDPQELKEQIKEESVLSASEANTIEKEDEPVTSPATPSDEVTTPLSLHETWDRKLSMQEKYSLSFMAGELPPMAPGNISLAGVNLIPHEEGIAILAFVRNGTPNPIRLGQMNLVVLIRDNELFTRQPFDLSELGEIPPFHARPWEFVFNREHYQKVNVMLQNWKIAFEIAEKKMVLPQKLELEESWIKTLSDAQKESLIQLAKRLPALKPGEVNVQSVQVSKAEDGSLRALLLIRNGSERSLSFEKLPLELIDATGESVAQGLFELGSLTVNAETSKPWLFIFPPESIAKEHPDLSRWSVRIPQG